MRRLDAGANWSAVNVGLTHTFVSALAIDPTTPSTLYAGTMDGGGVFKSLDAGANWSAVNAGLTNTFVNALAIDPTTPTTLYAGTRGGVFKLTDSDCRTDTTLCLSENRFELEVDWRDFNNNVGVARVVPVDSADSGLFWFFSPNNWEMLVKVLDGCGINNHFWVFAAATTNVEYTLRVRDTETETVMEYFNPLGTSAAAITDTSAFATCP